MIGLIIDALVWGSVGALVVWGWQRIRRRRLEAKKPVADLSTVNLIGMTGVLDQFGEDARSGQIRLKDYDGVEHVLPAEVEDAEEPLELGAEVLVIQNPTPYKVMVVVPNELPRLEDLPR